MTGWAGGEVVVVTHVYCSVEGFCAQWGENNAVGASAGWISKWVGGDTCERQCVSSNVAAACRMLGGHRRADAVFQLLR
jgi:hypothetical protein